MVATGGGATRHGQHAGLEGLSDIMGDVCLDSGAAVASLAQAASENNKSLRGPRVFSYKLALVAVDLSAALGVAAVGLWAERLGAYAGLQGLQRYIFLSFYLIPLAFFPNFRLYSYHLIFSPRYHLVNLCKAGGLGLFAIGAIGLTYRWNQFLPPDLFLPAVVGFSLAVLLANNLLSKPYREESIIVLLKALGLAFLAVGLLGLQGPIDPPTIMRHFRELLVGVLTTVLVLALIRCIMVHWVFNVSLRRHFRRQVLLIGMNEDAERITDLIIRQRAPFWIAGTVSPRPCDRLMSTVPKSNLGRIQDLESILGERFFQEAIITDETIEKSELIGLLDFFTTKGINVWFIPKLMPIIGIKLYIDNLCGIPMIRLSPRLHQWWFQRFKYGFDAMSTLAMFILVLPLFLAFSIVIKMTSPGPVFYRAHAVGKRGRFFRMFKFRSMITGTTSEIHKDYVTRMIKGEITQDGSGKTLKITNDPRITKVGRFLRMTSMDELPQLINVLKGEMSLVGPRPCLPYEYEIYKDWHKKRTAVRPGITGLWQVVGRSEVSFEDMILLDLYYIFNCSLELDLSILFETLFVVLKKKGAH
jgi:undecaprenyl-phosphate galactose phosphotransferase